MRSGLSLLAVVATVSLTAVSPAQADPKSHYLIHCMGCHLTQGEGQPPEVPVFGPETRQMMASEAGRAYLIQVPGAAQAPISDEALTVLMNWIIEEFTEGNETVTPFTVEEVTLFRSSPLKNPLKAREALFSGELREEPNGKVTDNS